MASIPCFLCGTDLAIRTDKNKKRYFICDHCGVQAFVRKETGIVLLENLLRNLRTQDFQFAKHRESLSANLRGSAGNRRPEARN